MLRINSQSLLERAPRSIRMLSAILGLGAGLASLPAFGADTPANVPVGQITGVLYTPEGKPVIAATLAVMENGQSTYSATHGSFEFRAIPEGTYTLSVNVGGHERLLITEVQVQASRVLELGNLTVPTDGHAAVKATSTYVDLLDKITVKSGREQAFTGRNIDLTRTENDPMPYVTFTQKDIVLSGAADLNEFITRQVTMNVSTPNISTSLMQGGLVPTSNLNLGNWNAKGSSISTTSRTGIAASVVVLVDGVPAPAVVTGLQGGYGQPDINGIPLNLIERIEVLPVSASTLYGPNALGGVINIVTKTGYRGGGVNARYETHTGGHDGRQSYSVNYAAALPSRTTLTVVATHQFDQPMYLGDVADQTVLRYRQRVQTYAPSIFYSLYTGPLAGGTLNIKPSSYTTSVGLLGTNTSRAAYLKPGVTGNATTSDFVYDSYNLNLANGRAAGSSDFRLGYDSTQRDTISLEAKQKIGRDWMVTANVSYYKLDYAQDANPYSGALTYQTLAAKSSLNYNPFSTSLQAAWIDPRLATAPGLGTDGSSKSLTFSSSITGTLFGNWRVLGLVSYSRSDTDTSYRTFAQPYVGGSYSYSNWSTALNGSGTKAAIYNPFVDLAVASYAPDSFYSRYYQSRTDTTARSGQLSARLRITGPLLQLPAGDQTIIFGPELDRNTRNTASVLRIIDTGDGSVISTTTNSGGLSANSRYADRNNTAGYAEINTPLLGQKQHILLVDRLDVQLSARYDHYKSGDTDAVNATVTQVGLVHAITRDISWRGSVSSGFQPPSADELTPNTTPHTYSPSVYDPVKGAYVTINPDQFITGGNPNLKAAHTNSQQLGLLLTPRWVSGLRLSADFSRVSTHNAISSYSLDTIVAAFPDLITRDAAGNLTYIDDRYLNSSLIRSDRIDYKISYERPAVWGGDLYVSASASQFLSYKSQVTPSYPVIQNIGNAHSNWQRDEWPGAVLATTYSRERWSFGWTGHYLGRQLLPLSTNITSASATNSSNDLLMIAMQGGTKIGSAFTHDFTVSYRYPALANTTGWRKIVANSEFSVGVKNLFDHKLRFNANDTVYGTVDDFTSLRSVWVSITKAF